jgi:preprotein translocase subunit SecF
MYLFKPGKIYDFMGMRKFFLYLSLILLAGSAFALWKPGPHWGTDFKGGTEVEVLFKKAVDGGAVREAVENIRGADGSKQFAAAEVISVPQQPNRYLIRVEEVSAIPEAARQDISKKMCLTEADRPADCTPDLIPQEIKFSPGGDKITFRYDWKLDTMTDDARAEKRKAMVAQIAQRVEGAGGIKLVDGSHAVVLASERDNKVEVHLKSKGDQLLEGLRAHFGPDVAPDEPLRVEWIGPKAGEQLRDAAFKSVGVALIFIMAYIALRFDLRFAPGAVIALIHDVLISLGAMCLTGREITLSTVAAVLTIMGYSLTDTVVVYDRIRENLGRHRGMSFPQLVNLSVSEMFERTLITSSTAFLSMAAFLVFGTTVIKDFAFAMLVGIVVGTYSSIYIAAPFTEWVDRRFFATQDNGKDDKKVPRKRSQKQAEAVV